MDRLRADTVFRLGALVGCGIIVLPYVVRFLAGDGFAAGRPPGARLVLAAGPLLVAVVFGTAFWLNTGRRDLPRPFTLTLLAIQVALGFVITDFFFLIAAEAPFVFAPRAALAWLGGQLAAFAGLVVLVASLGGEVAIPEMAGMPDRLGVPVTIVALGGWQVFAFGVGYLAAAEQRLRRDLQQRARELVATQQMLADSSRVAERAQFSRELHDTLGHSLTVLNVNLELARHLTDGRAADAVTRAQTVGKMLLADVREMVHAAAADDGAIDLRRALRTLAEGADAPEVHLEMPDDLRIDDPVKAHTVFRCVQEAITNAMRHADARHVWIAIVQDDSGVEVRIRDDGRGAATVTPGLGLSSMRQRLEAVQGRIDVQAADGRGFALEVWVPAARERS